MLHTKFQGHLSIASGEEDFLQFLSYIGIVAMLVMWPNSFVQIIIPILTSAFIRILVQNRPTVSMKNKY